MMTVTDGKETVLRANTIEHGSDLNHNHITHGRREQPSSSRRLQTLWKADDHRWHRITGCVWFSLESVYKLLINDRMTPSCALIMHTPAGQLKLQQAAVVVVGAGGLGCPALQYLAAAGVGK
jgi:hypothetical protein